MDEVAAGSPGSSAGRRRLMSAWRIVRAALIAYLLVALLAMLFEESLIFFPSPYPNGDWQPAGLGQEEVYFQAADGTRLHGWHVPHDQPRAVMLFCHGNAGNVTHRADSLRALHNGVGVAVFVFDYRGYGRSAGRPSEEGIIADARAARAWLAQRAAVPEQEIVVLGESLGGAVAVHLAAEDGAGALVLESTFTSVADMGAELYPWLPVRYLIRTRLDSLSKIAKYHGPVLISHGDCDTIVPFAHAQRLFRAANEPKEFVAMTGCDHNDPRTPEYYRSLAEFLDRHRK